MGTRDTNPWALRDSAKTSAQKIVAAIVSDITDRRGIGNEYEAIDDDTRAKMIDAWERIVEGFLP